MHRPKPLAPRRHAVFALAPGLLLVFKPRGHREEAHVHRRGQRLRVVCGRLRVHTPTRRIVLGPASRVLTIPAGRTHATVALEHTWLIAASLPKRRPRRGRPNSRGA